METIAAYSKLIKDASRILKHQKEISILKGENFNVFSILKMETKENATHSAFLGELLNPEGSHNMGTVFLKLFLETIALDHIDLDSARVKLEHYVGKIDYDEKTGGRVDIFIRDKEDNTICIENKINAPDQKMQIERYRNYNTSKNKVYYLTKEGEEPKPTSRGDLISGSDYNNISYENDIIEWLTKCSKETARFPILRESIQQYIILIKKMTNQLTDSKMEKQIQDIIKEDYKAVKALEAHVKFVEQQAAEAFIKELKASIKDDLNEDWTVEISKELNKAWAGLMINNKDWPESVYIKMEAQSMLAWNDSVYGIIGSNNVCSRELVNKELSGVDLLKLDFKNNVNWSFYKIILEFGNTDLRAELFDEEKRKGLVKEVSQKLIELSMACEQPLKNVQIANATNKTVLN